MTQSEMETKQSWWRRLRHGLQKSSNKLTDGLKTLFTHRPVDDETIEALEELLISADVGPKMAMTMAQTIRDKRFGKDTSFDDVRSLLCQQISQLLQPLVQPLTTEAHMPCVIMMVGVNGTGKTTTLGKLAHQFHQAGKKLMIVAGDTFRAAAIEQLGVWADRVGGVTLLKRDPGADPSGLVYEALQKAQADKIDIVLIDTAGRLHNRQDLMASLQKMTRVLKKLDATAPHHCLLVLDATTGQNALQQVKAFKEIVDITGLIVTKLDGTAKAGILLALADQFRLPVHAIGVGEGIEDLQKFNPTTYAEGLLGYEEQGHTEAA